MHIPVSIFPVRPARRGLMLAALAAVLLAGCSVLPQPTADPTRYYLLQGAGTATEAPLAAAGSLHLGVRSVQLPAYLAGGRAMVVRNGVNEVRFQDYARWAEPLDLAVQRAVRDRLLASGLAASAETPPFSPDIRRDLDILVRVVRCEGVVDAQGRGTAQFEATYDVVDLKEGGRTVVRREFKAPATDWNGSDYGQLASRLGEAAAAFGNDIAANLPK